MAADELSRTFAALADPTRRAILTRLSHGEASVGDLAAPFSITLPAVTKHLQVLERAGLVSRGRKAQWRPAMLRADPLELVADWVEGYRHFWESSFDSLAGHLKAVREPQADERAAATRDEKEERND